MFRCMTEGDRILQYKLASSEFKSENLRASAMRAIHLRSFRIHIKHCVCCQRMCVSYILHV